MLFFQTFEKVVLLINLFKCHIDLINRNLTTLYQVLMSLGLQQRLISETIINQNSLLQYTVNLKLISYQRNCIKDIYEKCQDLSVEMTR